MHPTIRAALGAVAVTAALALAACGDGEPDAGANANANARAAAGELPVTIEHKFGATTIESPPQRVVTVG